MRMVLNYRLRLAKIPVSAKTFINKVALAFGLLVLIDKPVKHLREER